MFNQLVIIAIGGAIGSVLRYLISFRIQEWAGISFPWGILVVNVIGCLLIGFLGSLLADRIEFSALWRGGLLIGFLGGFTTFSSFTWDSINLIENGQYLSASIYIVLSLMLSLLATSLGIILGRS